MTSSDCGALLGSGGAVASALFAVWPGAFLEDGVHNAADNPQWYFVAHMVAGTVGIVAILIAHRYTGAARGLLGLGAVLLLSMLVTEPFHFINFFANVLPALAMAAGALFLRELPATTSQNTEPVSGRV